MHRLLLSSAQVLAEDAVTLVDQLTVDVDAVGRNDRLDVRCAGALAGNRYNPILRAAVKILGLLLLTRGRFREVMSI